jgi:hypothetical protein
MMMNAGPRPPQHTASGRGFPTHPPVWDSVVSRGSDAINDDVVDIVAVVVAIVFVTLIALAF